MVENRPNIVLLVNNHQAFYGHHGIKRPHFDRLAAEGTQFTNAYCASPLCSPSRKSMLTGLYPHNHGQTDNSFETPIDSSQTYLDILKDHGYDNYYFGKWHAGEGTPSDLGCKGVSYPNYANPYLQKEYLKYVQENNLPSAQMLVEKNLCAEDWIDDIEEGEPYNFPREMTNEALSGILTTPKETHEAFYLSSLACKQLEEIKLNNKENPFMLRVDFWGPHQPYHPTQEYVDMYPPEEIEEYPNFHDDLKDKPDIYQFETGRGLNDQQKIIHPNPMPWSEWQKILSRCYAQISLVDEAGGQILNKLKELAFDENTLVIWVSDHGDALACHGGHFDKAAYLPEEVMRIPFAIKYPALIQDHSPRNDLVCNIDLAPTILGAAGLKFAQNIDGENILSLFQTPPKKWRSSVFCETHGHLQPHIGRMVVKGKFKYIYNKKQKEELYDLNNDPYELMNLVDDINYTTTLKTMRNELREWQKKTNDPEKDKESIDS